MGVLSLDTGGKRVELSQAGLEALLAAFAKLLSPAFTGTPTAPTADPGTSTTQLATTAFVKTEARIGAKTTLGVKDWNDITNARSGSGYTLLRAVDSLNAPPASSQNSYFHAFNFEYGNTNGSGTITQFAVPYGVDASLAECIFYRGRYSGTWSSWRCIPNLSRVQSEIASVAPPRIVFSQYLPPVKQTLTTTAVTVAGSSINYTPVWGAGLSSILYELFITAYAPPDSVDANDEHPDYGTLHLIARKDGLPQPNSDFTEDVQFDTNRRITFTWVCPSWGTTEATLSCTATIYSSKYPIDLHRLQTDGGVDTPGGTSSVLVKITEIKN